MKLEKLRRKAGESLSAAQQAEWDRCAGDVRYFVATYCLIYNATDKSWIPFTMWPDQLAVAHQMEEERLLVILKARQLGLTWLTICYTLWEMLFHPAAAALIFSRRDDEAVEFLDFRLKGVYRRLPAWLRRYGVTVDSKHDWHLANGSLAKAFPTTGGRSYTGSIVVVDEADYIADLDALMAAVKPTIDAGGKMFLISSVDKSRPLSPFKRIYLGAKERQTDWTPVFLPWTARPDRDAAWYAAQVADIEARTGALDDLYQEYPATDTEALAPRSLDKRIPPRWLEACYDPMRPLRAVPGAPALPSLEIYAAPVPGRRYVIGADPAEGNPNSDDSALTVLDVDTGEEVAALAAKLEPALLGDAIAQVSAYYNRAAALVERNNHGHTVLLWLRDNSPVRRLRGHDKKVGWMSSSLGKALLYTAAAEAFRTHAEDADAAPTPILHSLATYLQLASIEAATLRAPEGLHDDRADAYALAEAGRAALLTPAPEDDIPVSTSSRPLI